MEKRGSFERIVYRGGAQRDVPDDLAEGQKATEVKVLGKSYSDATLTSKEPESGRGWRTRASQR